jgi:hypothetical protein
VLGVLLAGLVAMQVEILKLGNSLGRSIERTSVLQSRNDSLQAGIAVLADDQRIERLAAGMGMVLPSPSLLTFVAVHPQHQLGRALANIHVADPTAFDAQLAAQAAAAELVAPALSNVAPDGSQTGTSQSSGLPGSTTTPTAAGATSSGGIGATGTGATGIGAPGTGATGTGATGIGATGTGATGTGATGTGATQTTSLSTTGTTAYGPDQAGTGSSAAAPAGTSATSTSPPQSGATATSSTGGAAGAAGITSAASQSGSPSGG